MECSAARELIDPYLDGELGLESGLALERHLAGCADCARLAESRKALSAVLRAKLPYHAAPPALRAKLRARHAAPAPGWLRLAASFLLVAGLSAALTYYWTPKDAGLAADEVFASHVRAMASESGGIEVASADEHTVKPWFAGKLDFSPPVVDLASEGFPLAGGRTDYIAGRTVAALLYRHRKHVITLFVWPAEERRALAASERRGDNLLAWADGRMRYWAVSDLNAEELRDFAARFAAATGRTP